MANEGKMNFLTEIIRMLIDKADEMVPGKDTTAKELWAAERLTDQIEAHDQDFVLALVKLTRLPVPDELVKKIVDNDVTDDAEKLVVRMLTRTAVRLVYASKYIKEHLSRKDTLTEEEQKDLDDVRKELDKAKPEDTKKK